MSQCHYWADEHSSVNIVQYNIGIGSDVYTQILMHIQTGPLEGFMCCLILLSKNSKSQKLSVTEIFHVLYLIQRDLISFPTAPLLKPMLFKLRQYLTESLLLKPYTWMLRHFNLLRQ